MLVRCLEVLIKSKKNFQELEITQKDMLLINKKLLELNKYQT